MSKLTLVEKFKLLPSKIQAAYLQVNVTMIRRSDDGEKIWIRTHSGSYRWKKVAGDWRTY